MSKENTCARVSFLIKLLLFFLISYLLLKKETLAQVFFCEFDGFFTSLNQVEYVSTTNVMVWKT